MPVSKKTTNKAKASTYGIHGLNKCRCSDCGHSDDAGAREKTELVKKKAMLIEAGEIYVPKDMRMPFFPSRSTAGPDAGLSSYTLEFRGIRVRLAVSKNQKSRFALSLKSGAYQITREGEVFVAFAWVLPTMAHSPNQAFLNLASKCRFDCAFCAAPRLPRGLDAEMSTERVKRLLFIVSGYKNLNAFALTSAVPDSTSETNKRLAGTIKAVKKQFKDMPIGVEAYFENPEDIKALKKAGADEIKINVEAWPHTLFKKVCPKRDQEMIFDSLDEAVKVFGRGKVTSNHIIGLGETDKDVEECIRMLAGKGVVVNLRALRLTEYNKNPLKDALGKIPNRVNSARLLKLAKVQKKILKQRGLSTKTFKTMCFPCHCCDLVPFYDL
jgi:biotin synthase-related radical SAM superfamily protein